MGTDIDIKDLVYSIVSESELAENISGQIRKSLRPKDSTAEDIVISMLANENGEVQEAFVNVNVYVPDILIDGQAEENSSRLRELCTLCSELLEVQHGTGWRMTMDTQRVMAVDGRDEHMINNKLLYKQINE